jgi:NitT/TauT family transport system permease protein
VSATELPALPVAASANPVRREWARHPAMQVLLPLLFAAAVLLLWEALVDFYGVREVILPAPSDIYARAASAWPFLVQHAIPTGTEAAIGFGLATVLGIGLAVLLSYSKWAYAALYPNVIFFQLIPKIALARCSSLAGHRAVLAAGLLDVHRLLPGGDRHPDRASPRRRRTCCACARRSPRSPGRCSWRCASPTRCRTSSPVSKIAVTFAIIGVIVGEFITAQAGLGYLILFASSQAETR